MALKKVKVKCTNPFSKGRSRGALNQSDCHPLVLKSLAKRFRARLETIIIDSTPLFSSLKL